MARSSRRKWMRWAGAVAAGGAAHACACLFIAWLSLRARPANVPDDPEAAGFLGDPVTFVSHDGTRLAGWLVGPPDRTPRGAVVLCHGADGTRLGMAPAARVLVDAGYAALLFDSRSRGASGGSRMTLGVREPHDFRAAVRFLQEHPATRGLPIGAIGVSLGAATTIIGSEGTPAVRAIVAESAFSRLDRAIDRHFGALMGPLAVIFQAPVQRIGERLIGAQAEHVSPEAAIARLGPLPVLIIHNAEDRYCDALEADRLARAASGPVELWTVPESGHIAAVYVAPEEYRRRVVQFFDRHLTPQASPAPRP